MIHHSRITLIWPCLLVLASFTGIRGHGACPHSIAKPFDPRKHKPVYKVGVLAIRGFQAAYTEFNRTFVDYLTATVGQRYDPPISFELKPLNFISLFADTQAANVDFIYVNPSAFSCIESEFTAHSLVSQISRRNIQGNIYDLKKFGGVMAARADNLQIQSIHDLKDKVIAAASISGLGSGQMQFLEMKNSGMSYINGMFSCSFSKDGVCVSMIPNIISCFCSLDPKQLVFTSNQGKVVNGVLSGEFDAGFIRTDQLERSKDVDGNAIDPKLFRIIDPKQNLTIDGEPFPFTASTALYPEWNIAALSHVAEDVSRELQNAMLALSEHAQVGAALLQCREQNRNDTSISCQDIIFSDDVQGATDYTARCDTTPEVAEIALDAMTKGKYAAWQTTLSYMQLRSMQEATGFISMDPDTRVWRCIRSTEIYDSISCPSGYDRKSREDVRLGCSRQDLECSEGYQCLCSPCAPIKVCVDAIEFNGRCVAYSVFLPSLLVPFFVVSAILVYCYVEFRRKQSDSVWAVQTSQLKFDDPPKIVGVGTFGLVLLAEYRGTAVAVKRVIPSSGGSKKGKSWFDKFSTTQRIDDMDEGDIENLGLKSMSPAMIGRALKFGSLSRSASGRPRNIRQLKADFVREMRHLAKLRHPCITTVMGAVISRVEEPMLVMEYMNFGSLHDVLHNRSIGLDIGEHILPILQDVAQGMRFLHAASPHQVVHGDLKAKNVLIDSNYRAKVTDFGLSAKKRNQASGTPFWMAPELLRGDSLNSSKSDMYAFGILIYEAYSRKIPYEGEDPEEVIKAIINPIMKKHPPVPPNCSARVAEMMKECLVPNPNDRPTSEQVDLSLRVEGGVKERTTRLEKLNSELAEANKKIASASAMQLVSTRRPEYLKKAASRVSNILCFHCLASQEHFACMSHEIRTPLNCIVGISSLLEDSDLSESQTESMDMIVTSGKLLQCIVDDVLDYSKLESGKAEVQISTADLQEMVSDLINSMLASTIARKRNVTIRTFIDPTVSRSIDTDGRRLLQILFNLFSNAVKFSKSNGVVEFWLNVCSPDSDSNGGEEKTPLMSARNNRVVRFVVKDYGKGIASIEFESIFHPFTQSMTGIANVYGGTGLGLAITRKLVEALGGNISVDSEPAKWTEFTVDLPCTGLPISVETLSTRLKAAVIYFVSDGETTLSEQMAALFGRFNVPFTWFSSMKEVAQIVKESRETSASDNSFVCMVQGGLFDREAFELACQNGRMQLVSFGQHRVESASLHYNYLARIFPSVLAHEIGDLIEGLEQCKSTVEEESTDPETLDSLKILIAEDNLVNQKVLKRLLNRIGVVNVEIVDNGKKAVAREAVEPFDFILMDMQMPVMDGTTACREILKRGDVGHPRPKIIFVTAHVSESFKEICLAIGAVAYLPKPCTVTSLKETLEKCRYI